MRHRLILAHPQDYRSRSTMFGDSHVSATRPGANEGRGTPARSRAALAGLVLTLAAMFSFNVASASAAVPFQTINAGPPVNQIYLGNELSCQVKLALDDVYSFYPSGTAPGDCGTFLAVNGNVYSPDFDNHDWTATGGAWTPFTPVSQSNVSGDGSAASPFTVDTVVDAGSSDVRISERTTYVAGESAYSSRITLANSGGAAEAVTLYRAGDCYLAGSDYGFGAVDTGGGVFCSENANNQPDGRVVGFKPADANPSNYLETGFSSVWSAIDGSPFADLCDCEIYQDNGAGLSWQLNVPAGGQSTVLVTTRAIAGADPFQGATGVSLPDAGAAAQVGPDLSSIAVEVACDLPADSGRACDPNLSIVGDLEQRLGGASAEAAKSGRATSQVNLASAQAEIAPGTTQAVTLPTSAEGAAALAAQQQLSAKLAKQSKKLGKQSKKLAKKAKAAEGKKAKKLAKKAKKAKKKAKKLGKQSKKLLAPSAVLQVQNPRNGATAGLPMKLAIPKG